VDSVRVAGRSFVLLGGTAADRLLPASARDADLALHLTLPGDQPIGLATGDVAGEIAIPFLDLAAEPRPDSARVMVVQSGATLAAVRRGLDAWFVGALGLSLALGLLAAAWLSGRVSRPLRELAAQTEAIDLDRLDQDFPSDRGDEIGALSRVLGAMTARLRSGAARLREAERRIALGDLARQVNHDIKNGLAPIRNVLRHLSQVLGQDPSLLPGVFEDRKSTLESSVEYLETLARNYARLSPGVERQPCDVNAIVGQVLRGTASDGTGLQLSLGEQLPAVLADSLMLRRILENLVGNAVDSVTGRAGGLVTVTTELTGDRRRATGVRITVADTGPGMTRTELDRAFDDFYTTKSGGTGLGLSIVRRLILDLNGTLRVETEPGAGTRVVFELPIASGGDATG
jgi:signal transduction histidine kinase